MTINIDNPETAILDMQHALDEIHLTESIREACKVSFTDLIEQNNAKEAQR